MRSPTSTPGRLRSAWRPSPMALAPQAPPLKVGCASSPPPPGPSWSGGWGTPGGARNDPLPRLAPQFRPLLRPRRDLGPAAPSSRTSAPRPGASAFRHGHLVSPRHLGGPSWPKPAGSPVLNKAVVSIAPPRVPTHQWRGCVCFGTCVAERGPRCWCSLCGGGSAPPVAQWPTPWCVLGPSPGSGKVDRPRQGAQARSTSVTFWSAHMKQLHGIFLPSSLGRACVPTSVNLLSRPARGSTLVRTCAFSPCGDGVPHGM